MLVRVMKQYSPSSLWFHSPFIHIKNIKQKSLPIDWTVLGNLMRWQAFCLWYPSIIQPKEISLLQSKQQNQAQVDNQYNPILPWSYLCEWKRDIEQYQERHLGKTAFVECKIKMRVVYNIEAINDLLKIHKACDVKKEVQRKTRLVCRNCQLASWCGRTSKICSIHLIVMQFSWITICQLMSCINFPAHVGYLQTTPLDDPRRSTKLNERPTVYIWIMFKTLKDS